MIEFPLNRMRFNGTEMIVDPPMYEEQTCSVRDTYDPQKPVVKRYSFNLSSESVIEPWEVCEENR